MDDFAYINARIRAMEGRLFDRTKYQALLAEDTPEGRWQSLRQSPYGEALETTRSRFSVVRSPFTESGERTTENGILLDEALRWDLAHSLSRIRGFSSDRPRKLMETLLLRWDVYNLKTVLRGKRAAAPSEEILASTFPVGALDEIALAELTFAPSLQALIDTLETWQVPLARPLRKALKGPGMPDSLQPLEFELDRFAFAYAFQAVTDGNDQDRMVKDYLRVLLDHTNLLTALRHLAERRMLSGRALAPQLAMGLEAGRYFLEADGGSFTRAHSEAVVGARDLRQGLSALAGTRYAELADAFAEQETLSLPLIERELDRRLIRHAVRLSREDPLGIGVALAYIERKINEVRNVRMIVRGRVQGMEQEQIAEWLIIE